ncbi:MAG: N-acetylmuramoyl-L-alanine amidase [Clostridiaceae bacterium]
MKIEIDKGHGIGQDRGAVGFIAEEEIINAIGDLVIVKLRNLGHLVNEARPKNTYSARESLNARCASANNWGADIFVSIHANAGGGTGAEVFTNKAERLVEAQRFLQVMLQEGFVIHSSNRSDINSGIKDGSDLAVINGTNMKAMLVEICFVDNQSDVAFYRSHIENIANAIVYGITGVDLRNQAKPVSKPIFTTPDLVCIDNPKTGFITSKTFELNGWALSTVNRIELLLNGKSCGVLNLFVERPDVVKAYPQYKKTNNKVGFKWGIDIKSLQIGENTLIVYSGNASQTIKVIRK